MDRLRKKFLARAAFSLNKQRVLRRRRLFCQSDALVHAGRAVKDVRESMLRVKPLLSQAAAENSLVTAQRDLVLQRYKAAERLFAHNDGRFPHEKISGVKTHWTAPQIRCRTEYLQQLRRQAVADCSGCFAIQLEQLCRPSVVIDDAPCRVCSKDG